MSSKYIVGATRYQRGGKNYDANAIQVFHLTVQKVLEEESVRLSALENGSLDRFRLPNVLPNQDTELHQKS